MPAQSTFGAASIIPYSTVSDSYNIGQSLRFNSADSAYLSRTYGSGTSATTWTISCWVKRSSFGAATCIFSERLSSNANVVTQLDFQSSDTLRLVGTNTSGSVTLDLITTQVFRDPSAWFHLVVAADSTQATASERFKIYINGSQVTSLGTATYPAQNSTFGVFSASEHNIGRRFLAVSGTDALFNGYITEFHAIDGQALTPSSFGYTDPTTGVWMPKRYTGAYGTNGFYLNFSNFTASTSATLGKDYSGNNNDWTPNNFIVSPLSAAACDIVVDSPSNYGTDTGLGGEIRGNYNTLNPISPVRGTIIDGNLRTNGGDRGSISTIAMLSGKWYCEMIVTAIGAESSIGLSKGLNVMNTYVGSTVDSWGYYSSGSKYTNNGAAAYAASYTTGDVIGCSFDADNGILSFYKNGSPLGAAFTGLTDGPYYFAASGRTSTAANDVSLNFGQKPFGYRSPLSAQPFKCLCTTNLPTPSIKKSSTGFDAITYNGTGTTFVSPSGLKFAPDLVWVKSRSQDISHVLSDTVRGAEEVLCTNNNRLSSSDSFITNFNQDGFTLNTSITANSNGSTYVAWCWDAGSETTTNNQGTITSTVRANPKTGFSIVTWTDDTSTNNRVGHGLGVAPKIVIYKTRNINENFYLWTTVIDGSNDYLLLNSTQIKTDVGAAYTSPTSTTISNWGTWGGAKLIAYCFAEVEGFSKFGSYVGNASSDGPFIYTGFSSRWILFKKVTGTADNWFIYDTQRNKFNPMNLHLYPQSSNQEYVAGTTFYLDVLSNGFKILGNDVIYNGSGSVYIFAAFAEYPFKYARAR